MGKKEKHICYSIFVMHCGKGRKTRLDLSWPLQVSFKGERKTHFLRESTRTAIVNIDRHCWLGLNGSSWDLLPTDIDYWIKGGNNYPTDITSC